MREMKDTSHLDPAHLGQIDGIVFVKDALQNQQP